MHMMISSPHPHRHHVPCPAPPPASPTSPRTPRLRPSLKKMNLRLSIPGLHLGQPSSNRRHSWQPGAVVIFDPQYEQRSVSLETLDPVEMDKVQYGGLGRRDPRRAPITHYSEDLETLLSLTEEEVSDSQIFSFKQEQSTLPQSYSASVPSLCTMSSTCQPAYAGHRPRSYTQEGMWACREEAFLFDFSLGSRFERCLGTVWWSVLYLPLTLSLEDPHRGKPQLLFSVHVDAELGGELWGSEERTEGKGVQRVESEEKSGSLRSLVRSFSFLGKMAGNRK
ncbi:hypothetical protein NFI96_032642, partial [Prochilodus magdalenae]